MLKSELQSARQVFLKVTYGFDPGEVSQVGYTREELRKSFLRGAKTGDLMVLYGAKNPRIDPEIYGKAFLVVEVEANEVEDLREGRWEHGIPITRAWRINFPIWVDRLAFTSYKQPYDQTSLIRGLKLSAEETAKVFALDVAEVEVAGLKATFYPAPDPSTLAAALSPSRGFPISHGERTAIYPDGVYEVYCLKLKGMRSSTQFKLAAGEGVFKVGISMNPEQRCCQLNSSFPPGISLEWEMVKHFFGGKGQRALAIESSLKSALNAHPVRSLGGEFFAGPESEFLDTFDSVLSAHADNQTPDT